MELIFILVLLLVAAPFLFFGYIWVRDTYVDTQNRRRLRRFFRAWEGYDCGQVDLLRLTLGCLTHRMHIEQFQKYEWHKTRGPMRMRVNVRLSEFGSDMLN